MSVKTQTKDKLEEPVQDSSGESSPSSATESPVPDSPDADAEADEADADDKKKKRTVKGRVFQCTGFPGCNMSFTRSEHLARHKRKHTGERPFTCPYCSKNFSRLENLRQHKQTVHAYENYLATKKPEDKDEAAPPPGQQASQPPPHHVQHPQHHVQHHIQHHVQHHVQHHPSHHVQQHVQHHLPVQHPTSYPHHQPVHYYSPGTPNHPSLASPPNSNSPHHNYPHFQYQGAGAPPPFHAQSHSRPPASGPDVNTISSNEEEPPSNASGNSGGGLRLPSHQFKPKRRPRPLSLQHSFVLNSDKLSSMSSLSSSGSSTLNTPVYDRSYLGGGSMKSAPPVPMYSFSQHMNAPPSQQRSFPSKTMLQYSGPRSASLVSPLSPLYHHQPGHPSRSQPLQAHRPQTFSFPPGNPPTNGTGSLVLPPVQHIPHPSLHRSAHSMNSIPQDDVSTAGTTPTRGLDIAPIKDSTKSWLRGVLNDDDTSKKPTITSLLSPDNDKFQNGEVEKTKVTTQVKEEDN